MFLTLSINLINSRTAEKAGGRSPNEKRGESIGDPATFISAQMKNLVAGGKEENLRHSDYAEMHAVCIIVPSSLDVLTIHTPHTHTPTSINARMHPLRLALREKERENHPSPDHEAHVIPILSNKTNAHCRCRT